MIVLLEIVLRGVVLLSTYGVLSQTTEFTSSECAMTACLTVLVVLAPLKTQEFE